MKTPIKQQLEELMEGKRSFIDASGENDHEIYAKDLIASEISADDLVAAKAKSRDVFDENGNFIGIEITERIHHTEEGFDNFFDTK